MRQDPVLNRVKLIAEPWDLGDGGYQVGNFPPGWAEWNDQYRDAMRALLEGRRRPDRRVRAAPHRLAATCTAATRPRPAREHQLHHRARRLHAARPGLLQREAQRGQRRGQPRRPRQQPVVELRRRRADRRSGDPRAARAAEAQLASPRCCCRRACRCCWPATRSAARRAATTTPTARTTRSAGSTGRLDAEQRRAARLRAAADRAAPRAPDLPPPRLLPGPAAARQRASRTSCWLQARRHRDDAGGLERRLRALPRRCYLSGRGHDRGRRARRGRCATTTSCCCSTRTTRRSTFTLPVEHGALAARCSTRRPASCRPRTSLRDLRRHGRSQLSAAGRGRSRC